VKELFQLIEKLIERGLLSKYGEILIKYEAGRVVICKETKSIKP